MTAVGHEPQSGLHVAPVAAEGSPRTSSIDVVSFHRSEFDAASKPGVFKGFCAKGGLGLVLTTAGAGAVAALVAMPAAWVIVSALLATAIAATAMATVPAHRRAISTRPALSVLAFGAGLSVVGDATGRLVGPGTSGLEFPLLAGAVVSAVAAAVHRQVTRVTPTVIVGPATDVTRLEELWSGAKDLAIVGTCSWDANAATATTVDSVIRDVPRVLRECGAQRVAIVGDRSLSDPMLRHLAWGLQRADIECLVVAKMNDYVEYVRPKRVGDQLCLVFESPKNHVLSKSCKSAFDRAFASLLLLAVSPLMAVVALVIKLDSPGSVLFRQVRSGKDGVPFTIFKFRSMRDGADTEVDALLERNEGAGPLFKMAEDPRVTRFGAVLRRTSIDELPQLFNVVRGDMSLVGPRPALERETSEYSPWVWRRLHVRPGLTGLWQVSGRSSLSWDESIRLDLKYVNNWSLWLDVRILVRTVGVVLGRRGAW